MSVCERGEMKVSVCVCARVFVCVCRIFDVSHLMKWVFFR